jgi:hypothetical protein
MLPAFIYCTGIDRFHLKMIMAYLQSGFPFSGHTGKVPNKTHIQFSKTSEGVEKVPLLISRFFGRLYPPLENFQFFCFFHRDTPHNSLL